MVKLWIVVHVFLQGVPIAEQTYANRERFQDVAACEDRYAADAQMLHDNVLSNLPDGMTFEIKHRCEVQGQPA